MSTADRQEALQLAAELACELEGAAARLPELARLLREARTRFVAVRGADLEELQAALAEAAEPLLAADGRRRALAERLGQALGLAPPSRAARLAEHLPPAAGRRLSRAAAAARRAAEDLKLELEIGRRLLESSADCQQRLLRGLAAAAAAPEGYGPDGRLRAGATSLLDAKI